MHIRYFCDTSDSALGVAALEYLRSFMRIAPVRVVTVSGMLAGRWASYGALQATPMVGPMINAVCCDPGRWTWVERIQAGAKALDPKTLRAGAELTVPATTETIADRVELRTAGVRNVLFAVAPPRTKAQVASAIQYEALVVPSGQDVAAWHAVGGQPVVIGIGPTGVFDHGTLRQLFLP